MALKSTIQNSLRARFHGPPGGQGLVGDWMLG
jgi:hypothetical protein